MLNNVLSCQHHQKRPKNAKLGRTCKTPLFHAKPLQKRPNFWNLALKMPTWQSWSRSIASHQAKAKLKIACLDFNSNFAVLKKSNFAVIETK